MILELVARGVPMDIFAAVTLEDGDKLRALVAENPQA